MTPFDFAPFDCAPFDSLRSLRIYDRIYDRIIRPSDKNFGFCFMLVM